jgi:hypothetical protein
MAAKRRSWRGGPPADGSVSSYGRVKFTVADVEVFAAAIELPIEGDPAAAADELGEAIDWYVTDARIQRTNSEQATAPEWGDAVAEWAAKGRILLGDRDGLTDLPRASAYLCSALSSVGLPSEVALLRYVLIAREQQFFNSTEYKSGGQRPTREETLSILLEETAWALRALEILGKRVKAAGVRKGKQVDRARLSLVMEIARVFVQLFPKTPFNVRTRVKSTALLTERRAFSDGPALRWCRTLLTMAPDRFLTKKGELPSELVELRRWAAKPDGLSKVIRKLNAKPAPESVEEKR